MILVKAYFADDFSKVLYEITCELYEDTKYGFVTYISDLCLHLDGL